MRLEEEGYLTYQPAGKVRARLYARSDSSFFLNRAPWSFTFHTNEEGEVLGMLMEVDEREPRQERFQRSASKVGDDTPPPVVAAENAGFGAAWSPLAWVLVGLVGTVALVAILRPFWSRRSGGA